MITHQENLPQINHLNNDELSTFLEKPFRICTKTPRDICDEKPAFIYQLNRETNPFCFCNPHAQAFVCTAQTVGTNMICDKKLAKYYTIKETNYCFCPQTYYYFTNYRSLQRYEQDNSIALASTYSGDYQINKNNLFYYNHTKRQYFPLSNFYIKITEEHEHIYHNKVTTDIILHLYVDGIETECFSVNTASYKNLIQIIKKKYAGLIINPEVTRSNEKLEHYLSLAYNIAIRSGIINKTRVYHYSGWQYFNNQLFYMEDNKKSASFICQTGFQLCYNRDTSEATAYMNALGFLAIARKDLSATLIPFLFLHLGITYTLFERAGFPVRFLLYLFGTSGSMKTSLTTALFYPFNDDTPHLRATFKDTIASIEVKMANIFDWVLRVDDYHPQEHMQITLKDKLENIIRYFGDGISKNRSNPQLQDVSGQKPRSVCCITGEKIDGTASSFLRCLLLVVDSDTYIGEKLAVYQKDPLLLSTYIRYFINHLEINYNSIISFISTSIDQLRTYYKNYIKDLRLVDTAAQLHLIADIILQYGVTINAISPEQQNEYALHWQSEILLAIKISRTMSDQMKPCNMYLRAIYTLQNEGTLKVATSKQDYIKTMDQSIGFIDNAYLYLKPDKAYMAVKRFWAERGNEYTASKEESHQLLYAAQILKTTSDGSEKNSYLFRTSLPNRPRMLAIDFNAITTVLNSDLR